MTDDPEITDPRDPYKRPDIVTELDRWLVSRASLREATVSHALLQGARDEIVALREKNVEVLRLVAGEIKQRARDEALEEAARLCLRKARDYVISIGQDNHHDGCVSCAAAIRALKNKAEPQS